ncbi:MAG: AAA family ATPase [Acidimicrobiia bacterium]
MALPSGTVTFLFSDLEVSTRLWEQHHDAMVGARARYFAIVDDAVASAEGVVFSHAGDGVAAAFISAPDALRAAVTAQRFLVEELWGETGALLARMALHTGEGVVVGEDQYDSQPLNRCARLMGVAHGGQLLVSGATAALVSDALVDGVNLSDLGEHRLRDLARPMRVFQVLAPGLRSEFPPLASLDAFPGNLPLQTSSFIGRAREIDRTSSALLDARVVTLTGVGGVGKTRLALQVAAEALPKFRDGVWLVELAAVRDPDDVSDAFATVLGVTPRGGVSLEEALIDSLGTKQLLLVVDNCEHVLDAIAALVEEITSTCPGVMVLATSREGLALEGERMIAVPSLASPSADAAFDAIVASDAVQLFVDRAVAADADFGLTPLNAEAVADVCRRLDGVPLAILLAAARVRSMSPEELASALDRRFDVLAGGRRRAVKRHQTLRATIDWSYDLLDEAHQRLLARLAVFAGGCAREAAGAICVGGPIEARAVLGLLSDLVDRSLVVAERGGAETRYRLLETIREYGEERLSGEEAVALRDAHARYYAEYTRRCAKGLESTERIAWGTRMIADSENMLAAFAHAVDTENLDLAVRMLEATPPWSQQIAHQVSFPVDDVMAMPGVEDHSSYPVVLVVAATIADRRGEGVRARELADAALEVERAASTPPCYEIDIVAARWFIEGLVMSSAGLNDDAAAAYQEAANCFRTTDKFIAGRCLGAAASSLCFAGHQAEAVSVATEAVALERDSGIPVDRVALSALAIALAPKDPQRARALLVEAMQDDGKSNYGEALQLVLAAAALGDWALTAQLAMASIPLLQWVNHRPFLHVALSMTARALAEADAEAAATIQGTAHALAMSFTNIALGEVSAPAGRPPTNRGALITDIRHQATEILAANLGADRLHELRDRGASMDTDSAVAYAMTRLTASRAATPA